MRNDRWWYMVMATLFCLFWVFYAGFHLRVLDRIEYQLMMNAIAMDRCSNALAALVVSKASPIKCKLGEFHYDCNPEVTNNFIHSVRFEEVPK